MLTRREMLEALTGAALSVADGGVLLSDFALRRQGEDQSEPFARALAAACRRGQELVIGEGTFVIGTPPGAVADAADHACHEIAEKIVRIRGAGPGRTTLVCAPRPTARNPKLAVSRPILKAVRSTLFSISGLTLDGGLREVGRGLRSGPDPDAAALLEVRGAARCEIANVTLTGFAGHWDTRRPEDGNYGRRGPLLVADCDDVLLRDVVLQSPTFREGVFIHSSRNVRVQGFRLAGDGALKRTTLSTPLHVTGPATRDVVLEDFAAENAWGGSLLNLGGPGPFTIRNLRAEGPSDPAARGGRGIDIGAEVNDAQFPGQAPTRALRLENVALRNVTKYGLKAVRRPDCALDRLSLGRGVRVDGPARLLDARDVGRIEGRLAGRQAITGTFDDHAIALGDCGSGQLEIDVEVVDAPSGVAAAAPTPGADEDRDRSAILRVRSGRVNISGALKTFRSEAVFDDVTPDDDGLHDVELVGLSIDSAGDAGQPVIRIGRGRDRRARDVLVKDCRLNGRDVRDAKDRTEISAVRARIE